MNSGSPPPRELLVQVIGASVGGLGGALQPSSRGSPGSPFVGLRSASVQATTVSKDKDGRGWNEITTLNFISFLFDLQILAKDCLVPGELIM